MSKSWDAEKEKKRPQVVGFVGDTLALKTGIATDY
jgi:hypothetical protein